MKSRLNKQYTEPVGAPDLARFRLVDMFSACTHPDVKESIVSAFSIPHSTLRVVVATIAFGMGIDCPNVHRVIHWGPSTDVELYKKLDVQGTTCSHHKLYCTLVGRV